MKQRKLLVLRTFRRRLAELMEENYVSQVELSKKVGYSQPQICMYLSGKCEPPAEFLMKASDAFGVSVDWLLGMSDMRVRL